MMTRGSTARPRALHCWASVLLVLLTGCSVCTAAYSKSYRVAGLFEREYEAMELSFKYAMQMMNLRNVLGTGRMLIHHIEHVSPDNSFDTNKYVCRQIKVGIAAVFGPITKVPRAHVQSICNAFEIPHLQAQWDSRDPRDYFSISVYPDYLTLSRAYADLIKYWAWQTFTVLYDDNDGLIRLQEVLKAAQGNDHKVTVRRLERNLVGMFNNTKEKHENHLIIDCDVSRVQTILHEALKVNMLSEYYHFHFTTLDIGLVDLENFTDGGANITAMRLIDPTRPQVMDIMSDWVIMDTKGRSPLHGQKEIKTEIALMFDAVQLFTRALAELTGAHDVSTEPLSCNKKRTWMYGNSLLNYMKSMDFEGLSGRIRFENGKRMDFNLDIVELMTGGIRKVGNWQPKAGINITEKYINRKKENLDKLAQKNLSVVTVYEKPYLTKRDFPDENGRMQEGFMIDLLDLIAHKLNFTYHVYPEKDNSSGSEV